MLAYYVNNKLFVCTYVSTWLPWEETRTPKWLFTINSKSANRRSKKYDNVPMPYAMHIIWGIFMHQGTSDWSKRSHGCVRVPGLYEEFLFYYVNTGTKIVIL
jgi:lipoprotein-anchoring transpeptidase ErfK/SrfK